MAVEEPEAGRSGVSAGGSSVCAFGAASSSEVPVSRRAGVSTVRGFEARVRRAGRGSLRAAGAACDGGVTGMAGAGASTTRSTLTGRR